MNQEAIQSSVNILNSLEPSFYTLANFCLLSPWNDKDVSEHFILALFYQLQTRKNDYYVDKSLLYKNRDAALIQLKFTRSVTSDPQIVNSINKIVANMMSKKPVNHRDAWPGEHQIFKMIKLNPTINDILPLKKLSSAVIKALHRHKHSINTFQHRLVFDFINWEQTHSSNTRKRRSENIQEPDNLKRKKCVLKKVSCKSSNERSLPITIIKSSQ